jgi:RNA polymerase sigma factor (sigma-70 family)
MSSSQNEWPALVDCYEDQYGPIDLEVYEMAREIWPSARVFAQFALKDVDAGSNLMFRAAAKVTARINSEGPPVENLKAYLYQTYKHLVTKQKIQRLSREHPLSDASDSLIIDTAADLERKILLRELFRQMSEPERELSVYLMFGYTYKEIAEKLGKTEDELRKRFSRLKEKLEEGVNLPGKSAR